MFFFQEFYLKEYLWEILPLSKENKNAKLLKNHILMEKRGISIIENKVSAKCFLTDLAGDLWKGFLLQRVIKIQYICIL